MILLRTKSSGATFVEVLAVVVVIGGILAAMGSTFIFGLKSYVGEYETEVTQVEAQRALAEFNFFSSRSTRFAISNGGDTVTFTDGAGQSWVFSYAAPAGGQRSGTMSVSLPSGETYPYAGTYLVDGVPFTLSNSGVSLYFTVDSSGGPVPFRAIVYPSYVL